MKRLPDSDAPAGDQAPAGRHRRGTALVSFVGAGPGSADLLTVRAVRCLAQADVVLHDALGCQEALALCPQAIKIPVGKRAGAVSSAQSQINEILVMQASLGQHVVRLKGGDPSVFGRLDEELKAVVHAGIAYEIIPGITAASALAAQAGVPLTQRGVARGVTLATPAVGSDQTPNPDWTDAASTGNTLAVYMAGNRLARTARQLLAAGFAENTPVLIGYGVATASQSIHHDRLDALAKLAPGAALTTDSPPDNDIAAPCLLLVGPAVAPRKLPDQQALRPVRRFAAA